MFVDQGEGTERPGGSPRHPLFKIGVATFELVAPALTLTARCFALPPKFD
jgi:hypothetical protein